MVIRSSVPSFQLWSRGRVIITTFAPLIFPFAFSLMVHGIYYSVQYEICLNKSIDFYDDMLPIWIHTRARIEIKQDEYTGCIKLIVIPYDTFSSMLYSNPLFYEYIWQNEEVRRIHFPTEEQMRSLKFVLVSEYSNWFKNGADSQELAPNSYDIAMFDMGSSNF